MNQQDRVQQAADALASVSGLSPVAAKRVLSEHDTRDLIASVAAEGVDGGAAGSIVSCVIARDANGPDIHDVGYHPILWDALYDNYQDFNTLTEIPDGLGLSFAFDGSSADITTTEAGVWSFVYNFALSSDQNWRGTFETRFGGQTLYTSLGAVSLVSHLLAIPTGTTFGPRFSTGAEASTDPFDVSGGIYLIVTRLA